jgi:hypothetical protein
MFHGGHPQSSPASDHTNVSMLQHQKLNSDLNKGNAARDISGMGARNGSNGRGSSKPVQI